MGESTPIVENKEATQKAEIQNEAVEDPKVFCPVQLSEENQESCEKEAEKAKSETEQRMQELLENVNLESRQLNESLEAEKKLINEVCMSLVLILKKIRASFNIPPQEIPYKANVKKAILNEEGQLVLTCEGNDRNSVFLAEYPPETVMAVLWTVIPELPRAITLYRRKMGVRTTFFERVREELKAITQTILGNSEGKNTSNIDQDNRC